MAKIKERILESLDFRSSLRTLSSFSTRRLWLAFHFLLLFSVFFRTLAAEESNRYYQDVGGIYSKNHTLYFQDGPYRATKNLVVQAGANLTIEQGVKIYFDRGVGIVVQGVLHAVVRILTRFIPCMANLALKRVSWNFWGQTSPVDETDWKNRL